MPSLAPWDEIRAVAGLSATDFPNIAMAHDTANGKLPCDGRRRAGARPPALSCPDCEAARAESRAVASQMEVH